MSILRKALLAAAFGIMISFSAYAGASGHITAFSPPSDLTLYPESIAAPGYQTAGLKFLPEMQDSEVSWSGREFPDDHNRGNNCSGYELSTCPAHASCLSCPFDRNLKKLVSCASGYTQSSNSCTAGSCEAIGYKSEIPANHICNVVTEGRINCYSNCTGVSCSGYSLNCDAFNVANSTGKTTCPDCSSSSANCSPKLCKVSGCADGYKIADNGTTCIALDDTCPDGYFKQCDTGVQGKMLYTEAGAGCYQCKPAAQDNNCPILTPVQKCAEEGYKTMNEWNKEAPNGQLLAPSDSETSVAVPLAFNHRNNNKSSILSYWFTEILGIKNASATSMMTVCRACELDGCKSSNCLSQCPNECSISIQPLVDYEFDRTAICPYDSSYVKGEWTMVSSKIEMPEPMECSSGQTRLICSGVTYCCASSLATCSTLNNASTNRCYTRACMTTECDGYTDRIAKSGPGWKSESCMPTSSNCSKGPAKYKNTCQTSIYYTLSSCPANTRCEGDCNNRYKVIGCDCGYTLKSGTCVADKSDITPAEPAYPLPVLYSDLTISQELVAGKTPIGVVFDENKKLAVALKDGGTMLWSTTEFDISGLTNSSESQALVDYNGKNNTKTIMTYCVANSKSCPAAEYASNFLTLGTQSGDWYLPALGELNAIYDNKVAINATMAKIGGTTLTENWHWSSSEFASGSAWRQYFGNGDAYNHGKADYSYYVRPVINYGDVAPICSVSNCVTCVSGSSSTCKTCESGYNLSNGKCLDECADICGQLYTGTCLAPCISKCRLGQNYHNITIGGKTCAIR